MKPLFTAMVIPEPHIYHKNKATRIDYVQEIKEYMNYVKDLHLKYADENLHTVFVGDIFDRSFNPDKNSRHEEIDMLEWNYWLNYFTDLSLISKRLFTVIGNHELSFPNRNPFWYMINELSEKYLSRYSNKSIKPRGLINILTITDELELPMSISLYFGHYKYFPKPNLKNNLNILISHNDILCQQVIDLMETKYNRDLLTRYLDYVSLDIENVLNGFDYAFIGHMHKAYGKYLLNNPNRQCIVQNLGSIGRTNETEVNDEDLQRVIPVIQIYSDTQENFQATSDMMKHGNVYVRIVDEPLTLKSREQVIDSRQLELHKSKTRHKELYKECIEHSEEDVNPLRDLDDLFRNDLLSSLIRYSVRGEMPSLISDCINLSQRTLTINRRDDNE